MLAAFVGTFVVLQRRFSTSQHPGIRHQSCWLRILWQHPWCVIVVVRLMFSLLESYLN